MMFEVPTDVIFPPMEALYGPRFEIEEVIMDGIPETICFINPTGITCACATKVKSRKDSEKRFFILKFITQKKPFGH